MKKILIILIVIIALVGGGVWWYNSTKTAERLQAKNNTSNYQSERSDINIIYETTVTKQEVEIANFSTTIYNKDEDRQKNITIACQTLSTKEVQPGEIFSFCNAVGKATHAKGYEEADIYVDGKKEQGLGGGMCQVSTTLYNAVLQVPELEVVERHQHSGHVPYIQSDKDAAIAYGIYDLKFKNNTSNVIKIIMENTPDNITAKLIKRIEIPPKPSKKEARIILIDSFLQGILQIIFNPLVNSKKPDIIPFANSEGIFSELNKGLIKLDKMSSN